MKSVTYQTPNGPRTIEYNENAPCVMCELPVVSASMGGTAVCPWCDCGKNRDGTKWSGEDAARAARNYQKNTRDGVAINQGEHPDCPAGT
jgi:hypothetical protein